MTRAFEREWVWRFEGVAPETIWAILADTRRVNEAAGLPKQEIEEIPQPDGAVHYFARCRKGPFRLAWREQPVNWVDGQWFEHCRHFQKGPLASLCASLVIEPTADGCQGRYRIVAEPANLLGQAMLRSGAFFAGAGRTFTRIADDARAFALGRRAQPFEAPPPELAPGARARAEAMVRAIEATPHGHGLAAQLADFLLSAQEVDVWRIRPLQLSREWRRAPREVVELCLQAVREGLLELHWELLCPRCRIAKASVASLDQLPSGAHCGTCNIDYERDFSRNVEAAFRPGAAVRPVVSGEYCLFGPISTPHILVQLTLEAGASRRLTAALPYGPYRLRTLEPGDALEIDWSEGGFPEMRIDREGRVRAGSGAPAGELVLINQAARPLTFIIEQRTWVRDALTADRVTALQAFRDLFSGEVLRPGDEVGITRITLMFTDLRGSTLLYERIGDAQAYRLVREHFAFLARTVREHDGAIVKTIGDAVMASFGDPLDALEAALAVQTRVAEFNRTQGGEQITIKLGLHSGPCIAVTLNDRLDYFGSTVNLAARLEGQSEGGDVVLSESVLADPRVGERLAGYPLRREFAELKGFTRPVGFLRLTPDALLAAPPLSVAGGAPSA
jgi:class 3 adenylate cyclase